VAIYAFVPSAAAVLADWGADVLKVEHPVTGDPGRTTAAWGVPSLVNGVSHLWEVPNRGKRNEPAWVMETLRAVAATRNVDAAACAAQIGLNFRTLFGEAATKTR
jgi:hypothetical protein